MRNNRPRFVERGFTLIEVMVVVMIIAIMVTAATISIVRIIDRNAAVPLLNKIHHNLLFMQHLAIVSQQQLGIVVSLDAIHYVKYVAAHNRWQKMQNFVVRESLPIPETIKISLHVDNSDFKATTIEIDNALNPDIIIAPGGEITPFSLKIIDSHTNKHYELLGDYGGQIKHITK